MTPAALEVKKPNGSEPAALMVSTPTPMDLLQTAVANNLDIDKLQKLMELQLTWEKNEARKAFVQAMNAFKANPPSIAKNKHVKFGTTEYHHATLDHVCDQVAAALSKHGISHRWKVQQVDSVISVTCVLTHEQGHSEETTLCGPADNSGSKNAVQAIGSTVTYLQRYTLMAATGLAAENDADGRMSNGELNKALEAIEKADTIEKLQTVSNAAYKEAGAKGAIEAQKAIVAAKDKRKKELSQPQGVPLEWGKK